MTVTITDENYKPTPYNMAIEICNMDAEEQLEILYFLANVNKPTLLRQLDAINDELKQDPENYHEVIKFAEYMAEYLTGKEY